MPAATQEVEAAEASPPPKESPKKIPRNRMLCRVTCLDKTFLTAEMQKTAKGINLMHRVAEELSLQEKEYFGLLYDHKGEKYWLEPQKEIKKQLKGNPPNFQLAVKFYEPYPSRLKTDYTRYMLSLQVRDDINCERLPCSFGAQALLGSYVVQAEIGDYDPREHKGNYLQGMVFSPNQTRELCEKIKELHKEHRGVTPEQCDIQYLEAARKLTMYGVDAHPSRDGNGDEVLVGVSYAGVLVFKDDLRQNQFIWPKVNYLSYKGRNFEIKSRPGELEELTTVMIFKLPTEKAAKRLYKSCVEHHTFFRLTFPDPPPSKTDTLLKLGSKFRYSDRTLYQLRKEGFPVNQDQPRFHRVSSKNWSHRQAPSTTEIIVVADEEAKKRPLDDKDKPMSGRRDKRAHLGDDRQAPLSEEEMMATMTMEEREEYKKRMAERLGQIKTTTTTTTVYYPGQKGEEGIPLEHVPINAEGVGVVDNTTVVYGAGERPPSTTRVTTLMALEEEKENKRKEEERRRKKEKEREEREREERERQREREKQRKEKEILEAAERAVYAARQPPSERIGIITSSETPKRGEAAEILEFSFATPVSSGETIKRAKMKSADTDSYKGRVVRVVNGKADDEPKYATDITSKTLSWSAGPRPGEPYSRGYTTLPSRGERKKLYQETDEDRRRSADDLLDNGEEDDKYRRNTSSGVPLVTKEELVRYYSPSGASLEATPVRSRTPPEIKRSLKDDLNLDHEQGERGFVRENIKRYSGGYELEDADPITEVTTRTVTITADQDPQVYRQKTAPEVKTKSYTINNVGEPLHQPITEEVQITEAARAQADPNYGVGEDGGIIVTRTVTIDGNRQVEPVRTETIKHTTLPTEIITKTITIEGDGGPLTAQELKEIMAQQAWGSQSEVITTTYTTTSRTQKVEQTVAETMNLVDEQGNVIATGDPDTDAAIAEAIKQAKEADPNVKVTEIVITRGDETTA